MIQKYNPKRKTKRLLKSLIVVPMISLVVLLFGFSDNTGVIILNDYNTEKGLDNPPKISPIKGLTKEMISMGFGKNFINPITKKKKNHAGIDIIAKIGTPILAPASGKIMKVEEHKGYGKLVVIKHDEQYSTVFAHLSKFNCEIGDEVKEADVIGYVGSTGMSTGPHLHYEVLQNGERINPMNYMKL